MQSEDPSMRYRTRSNRILSLLQTPRYETKGLTPTERNNFLMKCVENVETSTHSLGTNTISNIILDNTSNNNKRKYKSLKDELETDQQNSNVSPSERNNMVMKWMENVETSTHYLETNTISNIILDNTSNNNKRKHKNFEDKQKNYQQNSNVTNIDIITSVKVSTDLESLANCKSNDGDTNSSQKTTDKTPENDNTNSKITNDDNGYKSIAAKDIINSNSDESNIDCESIKSISMYRESSSEYQPSTSYVSDTEFSCKNSARDSDSIIMKSVDIVYNINDNKQKKVERSDKIKTITGKNGANRNKQVRRYTQEERNKHEKSTDSESEPEILVNSAKRNEVTGKRIRDKRHCCYFCHKIMGNLARHFELMHKNETPIVKILIMPKHSKRRREAFGELIRAGDFHHNCEVMTLKRGELILVRRPSEKEKSNPSYSNYGPCPDCLGFMMKKRLWHHIKYNCKSKNATTLEKQKRKIISESTALLHGIIAAEYCTEYNDNILAKFKNDDISEVCKNDSTILKFGYLQFEKYGNTQCELIRQTMRQLGRFLIRVKLMKSEIKDLADCLLPKHFDLVLVATKSLCGRSSSNTNRPEFAIPSLALKLGHAFKKCLGILKGIALRQGDIKNNEIYTCFLNLMEMEWSNKISSCALSTMYKRKFNHKQLLPLTEDLVVLTKYLDNVLQKLRDKLASNGSDYKTWRSLASCTLTRIILFNKKRTGEASKLTIEQYATRPSVNDQGTQEFLLSLSPLEKKLASTMDVVDIEGKRGSRVPVLLTPDIKSAIDLLIKSRSNVDISSNNPYVFAPANSENGHLRGHDCLRAACEEANLKHPDFITGTKLRKYIATVCQLFNLRKNEADWLARHLGHDIRVHRNFYRLHENAVETTKISRILIAVEQGEANKYAGKSLEEINIEDLPGLNEDVEDEYSVESTISQTHINNENDSDTLLSEDEIPLGSFKKNKSSESVSDAGVPVIERKAPKKKSAEQSNNLPEKKHKVTGKMPWNSEEIRAVLEFFQFNLKKEILPGKEKCTECIEKYPVLSRRKWSDIKFYLKNYYTRNRKMTGGKSTVFLSNVRLVLFIILFVPTTS